MPHATIEGLITLKKQNMEKQLLEISKDIKLEAAKIIDGAQYSESINPLPNRTELRFSIFILEPAEPEEADEFCKHMEERKEILKDIIENEVLKTSKLQDYDFGELELECTWEEIEDYQKYGD